ncbi:PHF2 [Acanthosepion pharaonis]|uniref:PHF2 n=1 Tax=Acanthosepion pharaonis TaxID=158019 RepID=A0A812BC93_ACAPH|nr:PHF2 [Sepia pharaonis]
MTLYTHFFSLECEEDGKKPSDYIIAGGKALSQHLKSWTQRKDLNSQYIYAKTAKHDVPEHIQYGKLLKELIKVSRNFEVQQKTSPKPKVERKRRKKNIPTAKQMQSLDILHQHTTEKLQELQKQEHKNEEHKNVYAFSDEPPSPPPTSLKMRIPKAGAFFDNMLKTAKEEEENVNPVDISSLKLKVSNGRIVGDNSKPDVLTTGKFQPLVADFDDDRDSDPDQLVVDESPTVRKKNKSGESNSRGGTAKAGSLKLKLSFSGKNANEDGEATDAQLGGPPPPKQARKTPASKKEKKPPAPKTKNQTAKTPATKKTPKKAQPKSPKGKGKQAKPIAATSIPTFGGELVLDSQLCQKPDLSHLNIKVPAEIPNWIGQDSLLLKMKDDDEPQKLKASTLPAQTLISKKPDPLSLASKRPDPLSLTPSRPDPLSLTPARPDPLSLLLKKPDPLSLTSKRTDPLSLLSNRPDPLSLTPTRPDPLSLLNKRPEPLSAGVAKPDPLSEAFSNNKEPLTAKDKSSLGSPKLESLAKKSTAADQSVNQTASKLKKPEEASASQDLKTKVSGKKEEEATSSLPKVDFKVDQLASILKSESLLSKAKLDTLGTRIKPLEMLPAKIKEADNTSTKMKPPEAPVLKGKISEGNTVKLKPPDLLGGTKLSTGLMHESKKPEIVAALRAELYAKQVAMQAKIAEEEGGGSVTASKKDLSVTETEQSKRMMMPTIRGGLNCGIADILEASGYGTETDFQVDEDVRAPSPTMRDAIQGMLSMSRMGSLQLFSGTTKPPAGVAKGVKQWEASQAEEEEQLGVCYKDEEYIYTSLDLSDDEDQHIFKPRGKQKKDETWNPKARVSVPGEKRERIARDSAKRESMESTLAATAAKYENLSSKPKKTNRKRLKLDDMSEETETISAGGHAALSHPLIAGAPVASSSSSATNIAGTNGSSPVSGEGALVIDTSPVAGTSTGGPTVSTPGISSSNNGGVFAHNRLINQPLSCSSKPKKPKKGFATAKQRLGRILKIHKMRF